MTALETLCAFCDEPLTKKNKVRDACGRWYCNDDCLKEAMEAGLCRG